MITPLIFRLISGTRILVPIKKYARYLVSMKLLNELFKLLFRGISLRDGIEKYIPTLIEKIARTKCRIGLFFADFLAHLYEIYHNMKNIRKVLNVQCSL